jgi:hypothetical protein
MRYKYRIDLPTDQALRIKDGLENDIWIIAKETGYVQELRNIEFSAAASEVAPDINCVIEFVISIKEMQTAMVGTNIGTFIFENFLMNEVMPRLEAKYQKIILILLLRR